MKGDVCLAKDFIADLRILLAIESPAQVVEMFRSGVDRGLLETNPLQDTSRLGNFLDIEGAETDQ